MAERSKRTTVTTTAPAAQAAAIPFDRLVDRKRGVITADNLAEFIWPDMSRKAAGRRLRSLLRERVYTDRDARYTRYGWAADREQDQKTVAMIVQLARATVGRAARAGALDDDTLADLSASLKDGNGGKAS